MRGRAIVTSSRIVDRPARIPQQLGFRRRADTRSCGSTGSASLIALVMASASCEATVGTHIERQVRRDGDPVASLPVNPRARQASS